MQVQCLAYIESQIMEHVKKHSGRGTRTLFHGELSFEVLAKKASLFKGDGYLFTGSANLQGNTERADQKF